MCGSHREVGGDRVEPVAHGPEVAELHHLGVLGSDHQGSHLVPYDDMGDQRRIVRSESGAQLVEVGRFADRAGALAVPPALPHPLAQLLGPPGPRRTPLRLLGLQQAQLGQVAGHLLVGRRAARG